MNFAPLWRGGPLFAPGEGVFPLGTDSVLLSDFVNISGARRGFDLGFGSGILGLLLLARKDGLRMDGVDISPAALAAARANFAANGFSAEGLSCADLREHRSLFSAGSYDLVVANPPYFPEGSGAQAARGRAAARAELSCTLEDVVAAAAFLCRSGGSFYLVHRTERLAEALRLLGERGLEAKRLRLVAQREGRAPILALIEGRRGGKVGLRIEPTLLLEDAQGAPSAEYRRIYHMEEQI